MSVDNDTVKKIARLARLQVAEDRRETLAGELNAILSWIEELNTIDTDNVDPLASVTGHNLPIRDDVVSDGNKQEQVIANAPESTSGFFVVPKVVE